MKRVTLTDVYEFDDDVSDETAIDCAIEIHSQNRHWPNDSDIKIETNMPELEP